MPDERLPGPAKGLRPVPAEPRCDAAEVPRPAADELLPENERARGAAVRALENQALRGRMRAQPRLRPSGVPTAAVREPNGQNTRCLCVLGHSGVPAEIVRRELAAAEQ